MAQSDSRFGYRAKLSRTDHDLSRPFGFTCAPGQLLPVHADVLTPHESVYIDHDLTFLRTAPLAAPAMIDVKVHYETFFVPMQMIYQPFENTIFSLKNLQSSLYNLANLQNNNFPLFDYASYVSLVTGSSLQRSKIHFEAFRLADMLDLNAPCLAFDSNNPSLHNYSPSFFPWQLLAYHTIFEYYYRLDDKSQFVNALCNFDQYYASTSAVAGSVQDMMKIHYRPWKFDYYTSLYRSPIVSDNNMQSIFNSSGGLDHLLRSSSLSDYNAAGIGSDGYNVSGNNGLTQFSNKGVLTSQSSVSATLANTIKVDTAMIRQMFANEKLAMITGRARKTYDSQVLAHFGVEVPHDVKHDLTLVGADSYPIHIGEVTSLASTSDAGLGDLAGKGWAQGKGKHTHKFTAPCHGVLMTIFSIEPEQRYYGGFARQNSISNAFDIPTPEFDRMGNVPMFRYELANRATPTQTDADIVGWKERYYANKRRGPKTTYAFSNPGSYLGFNSYSAYMISNPQFAIGPVGHANKCYPDSENAFYIGPHAMDSLMMMPYVDYWIDGTGSGEQENWNKTPWLAYARDPFIVDSFVKVKKISWMSKDGEPIYPF